MERVLGILLISFSMVGKAASVGDYHAMDIGASPVSYADHFLNTYGNIFLHVARNGNLALVKKIFAQKGATLDIHDVDGRTPLHEVGGNVVEITKALVVHSHPKVYNNIDLDRREILKILIAQKADVNAQDAYGCTPLHYVERNIGAVKILLDAKADPNLQDKFGSTLLHWEMENGNAKIIRLLLKAGAQVGRQEVGPFTPLHEAGESASMVIEAILANKNPIYSKPFSRTTSGCSVSNRRIKILKELLLQNADVNAKDPFGCTPLHYVARNPETIQMLLEAKADPNIQENSGMTLLHWEIAAGDEKIIKLLLEAGSSMHIKNKKGKSPLDLAIDNVQQDPEDALAYVALKLLDCSIAKDRQV